MKKKKDDEYEDIVVDPSTSSGQGEDSDFSFGSGGEAPQEAVKKIKKLKEDLKKCLAEKKEYLDGWQRAKADLINARKDDEKKVLEFIKFAESSLLQEILPITDNFERAFSDKNWERLDKTWQDGIRFLHNQFLKVLKEHKLEPIEAAGKKFDPSEHESIGEVEVEQEEKDGVVIEEAVKGYKLHGKLLRPVQVKVGKYKT